MESSIRFITLRKPLIIVLGRMMVGGFLLKHDIERFPNNVIIAAYKSIMKYKSKKVKQTFKNRAPFIWFT